VRVTRLTAVEAAACVAAVVVALAPLDTVVVEQWFSSGVYPRVQGLVTPVSNVLPFAALDLLIVLAAGLLAAGAVALVRAIRMKKARTALRAIWHLAAIASLTYLVFLGLWGLNYRRVPMSQRLELSPGPPSSEAVTNLGLQAALELNRLYPARSEGSASIDPSDNASLRDAFVRVQRTLTDANPAVPGRLKQTLLGPYFRWASVDGMINPFGLEVLANPDLLPFEEPFVAAHEWAHLAGYADESEASYVGWLTCVRADPASQYSGWMALYWQVSGEVSSTERQRLMEALDTGPRSDLDAAIARVRRGQQPWVREIGWRLYDRYLKANRVDEGVRSYGAVVTLILLARVDESGNPVRRGRTAAAAAPRGLSRAPSRPDAPAAAAGPARARFRRA
jgi:hypothetical protein